MSATMTTVIPQRRVMSVQTAPPRLSAALTAEPRFGRYILGQTLGEGEFGKVKLGWPSKRIENGDNAQVAIKLIRRESVGNSKSRMNKIEREIKVLRKIRHPNLVRCYEVIETEKHIGIILEYASGGELFDFILAHRYLKDVTASRLFAQLISAVRYLHARGIVHRDLKLENLLLDRNRNIIVTDFGFANTFDPLQPIDDVEAMKKREMMSNGQIRGDLMQTSCGSPCYAAPELVVSDGWYCGSKVDVWSCGVILYAMLAGYLPFDDDPTNPEGDNISLLYKYIVNTPLTFPEYVSPLARDLLRRILVPNPSQRASLSDVVCHSWLASHVKSILATSSESELKRSISKFTTAGTPQSEDMIRSASERTATHTSFTLPANNHLVPTGFSRNSSMAPPSLPAASSDKRHSIQIDYKTGNSTSTQRTPAEKQVETLSIPVAPTMARSASHTGANSEPIVLEAVSQRAPSTTISLVHNRGPTRLPAPAHKPRPTSYHPAYRRADEEISHQKRIPSDPPASMCAPSNSSGSGTSKPLVANWPKVSIHESKTASPRSTRQNAAGEIYSTSSISELSRSQSAQTSIPIVSSQGRSKPAHKRNSSSISTLLGKLWPGGPPPEAKSANRASQVYAPGTMESIGEIGAMAQRSATSKPSDTSSLVQETWEQGTHRARSRYSFGVNADATSRVTSREPEVLHQDEVESISQHVPLSMSMPVKALHSSDRTSKSAARRFLGLFSTRRREKDGSHNC